MLLAATLGSAGAGATAAEGYDLAKVRHMDGFVGSARARELLARQGMVVTDLAFRQVFVPYTTHAMMAGMPVFITTDSAWSGYHVLLELGLHRLEEIQSRRLEAFSRRLTALALARAHGDGAYLDLARFAAVGLVLQNPAAQASLDSRVRADVEKLAAALGRGNGPVQVGFVELPVAAGRLRASGIYTGEGALARYFAARQWYALCVFRSESVEETRRAFRLAFLVCGDDELHRTWQRLTAPYDAMLGPTEDGSVEQYAAIARKLLGDRAGGNGVDRKIRALQDEAAKLPPPLVNDQRLDDPAYARFGRETCGLRLLGPRRIPSGVVFQQTVDPRIPGRFLPSALDFLAVGPLASPAGQRALRQASQDPKVADLILQAKAPLLPDSLHSRTLRALALLQGPVPKAAPAALRSPAWRDKQLATQMAAWAQQRHTWALHTKVGETAWGGPPGAPGIIAPYPEFFAALAALSRATARELAWATRPDEKGLRAAAWRMKEEVAQSRKAIRPGRKLGKDAWELQAARRLVHICCGPGQAVSLDSMRQGLASLEKLADKCAAGEPIQRDEHTVVMLFADGWRSEIFDSPANMDRRNVPGLLRQFALFCDSLAEICRAQLVGKPLTGEQWQTLGTYGVTLARFHLHGDAAYAWPRDDAPQM